MNHYSAIDAAEAELQQELREMFTVDTQQHLETYFSLIQQLNARSWAGDIQHLYRAIHTVKGGAVTVAADAILHAAMVLEDLLSDLRYLEQAPLLTDGVLIQILLEAGELLSSSVEILETGDLAIVQVQPTINRLAQLRDRVKQLYLSEWNELRQVHQEFAEQGFDLVVLDLEMAVTRIADRDLVPGSIVEIARSTIAQLTQIGIDLELTSDWTLLLEHCDRLITNPDGKLWTSVWFEYFEILKACVKNSGKLTEIECERLAALDVVIQSASLESASVNCVDASTQTNGTLLSSLDSFFLNEDEDLLGSFDNSLLDNKSATLVAADTQIDKLDRDLVGTLDDFFLDEIDPAATLVQAEDKTAQFDRDLVDVFDSEIVPTDREIESNQEIVIDREIVVAKELFGDNSQSAPSQLPAQSTTGMGKSIDVIGLDEPLAVAIDSEATFAIDFQTSATPEIDTVDRITPVKRNIQIPVPLERLDKSAQQVVDTLLTSRAVMDISDRLQSQLAKLTILTRENSQFVTRLRQLQDDYALMRDLRDERQDATNNVTIERYRQGYTTINRLLENILRLSELGQEIESSTYQNSIRLEALDRSIIKLKDGIETSRLVPFRNLSTRAKAILRDLTNRYGKPAKLTVENEHIELDAGTVQQLEPALLHLLRNAYDHGLESIQQRLDAGKPTQGQIQISLQNRGNMYRLTISDDGGGIDAERIHQLAKSKGFALDRTGTNAELLAVLCQPGFSSSSQVTEVSGRGVGMDVVVSQIAAIGGKLSLETQPGLGSKFSIEVPAPQLLIPCVMFQVGDRVIAFPTDNILETALIDSMMTIEPLDDLAAHQGLCTWQLTNLRGELPGFDLHDYWQVGSTADKSSQRTLPDTAICIRTQQAENTPEIWTIADNLLGQAKLLINPLPSPLIAPDGLLGVSLQPDGRLISILDPISLSAKIVNTSVRSVTVELDALTTQGDDSSELLTRSSALRILIVDDAAMIRRRLEASLNTYGFITYTCNDGLEALNWLQTNPAPDLMITDVEMPNMDGFTLIDRVRQSQIHIPILVVSSRLSDEWGQEARRLGATDYLNKGFATSELIQKVHALLELVVNA